jgi:hypothetical protein
MEDQRELYRVLLGGERKRGKLRKRWLDDVEDVLRKTGVK